MATKVGGGGPRGFILGLIVGILLTVAYYHFNTAAPAVPAVPAGDVRAPG